VKRNRFTNEQIVTVLRDAEATSLAAIVVVRRQLMM
jgi:hypothetical protein